MTPAEPSYSCMPVSRLARAAWRRVRRWLSVLTLGALGGCTGLCSSLPDVTMTASVSLEGLPAYLPLPEAWELISGVLEEHGIQVVYDGSGEVSIGWAPGFILDLPLAPLALTFDRRMVVFSSLVPWSLDGCGDRKGYDLATILHHELGHVAGLGHAKTGVMKPRIDKCEVIAVCTPSPPMP